MKEKSRFIRIKHHLQGCRDDVTTDFTKNRRQKNKSMWTSQRIICENPWREINKKNWRSSRGKESNMRGVEKRWQTVNEGKIVREREIYNEDIGTDRRERHKQK